MTMWRWWKNPEQYFFRWALSISLLCHLGLLAWMPTQHTPSRQPDTTLEMIIVNTQTQESPSDPNKLAQVNLQGGGLAQEGMASRPVAQPGQSEQEIALEALTRQRAALESEQNALLEQLLQDWVVPVYIPQAQLVDDEPSTGVDQTDQAAMQRNAEIAAQVDRIERYNALPKRFYDAPNAQAHPYVEYIEQWRQKIEQTGKRFYPGDQNNRPTGTLQATVTIDSTGQVVDIDLDRPSSLPVLNQAVRRIVQLAAPFAPFPTAMRQQIDQIVITRTWEFKAGQITTSPTPQP